MPNAGLLTLLNSPPPHMRVLTNISKPHYRNRDTKLVLNRRGRCEAVTPTIDRPVERLSFLKTLERPRSGTAIISILIALSGIQYLGRSG
jgi:hypothetical protein